MKRLFVIIGVLFLGMMLMDFTPAFAAKPQNVIKISNGFPSGAHHNLNIHGKGENFGQGDLVYPGDIIIVDGVEVVVEPGGSIFIPEYTLGLEPQTIIYQSDKRNGPLELEVWDPYTEEFDGDSATVKIPYESSGYYVFGRILGKPNNGDNDAPSTITLGIPSVMTAGMYYDVDESEILLGYVDYKGEIYQATPEGFVRFATTEEEESSKGGKGKGKSRGKDITDLFTWSGWIVDESLAALAEPIDEVTFADVEAYNLLYGTAYTSVEEWLAVMAVTFKVVDGVETDLYLAYYFSNVFVFNIADAVDVIQGITNDGTKLLQIRFYPVDTTEFTRDPQ